MHKYRLAPTFCAIVTVLSCTVAFLGLQNGFASHGSAFDNSFVSTVPLGH